MSRIVVLAGEGEYESATTMKPVADSIAEHLDAHLTYRTPDVLEDWPSFPSSSFGSLESLHGADLLIFYTRFRILPDAELQALAEYLDQGGNLLALRTSTHAFRPRPESDWSGWTERFAATYIGTEWTRHHGHTSTTDITTVAQHPVTDGLPAHFHVDSWLYVSTPPPDAEVLLWGDPVDPEKESEPSPVAWVRQLGTQRIFYTSLGGQSDLQDPIVLRLLENAAAWCVEAEATR
ncbi:MAG: hypothetical protein JWP75_402 [Frondihabitans sp.]|nr:hypothetical protein [Frondihabitans sp.]